MLKLSIIIPHYNSSTSLEKLILSIPNKSEIETIIVDDYSNEHHKNQLAILSKKYAKRNIYFIENNTNKKSAGSCRNLGLSLAKGKWVLFADADDYFINNFYEIVRAYFHTNYDVIFFKPTSRDLNTNSISRRHIPFAQLIGNYLNDNNLRNELQLRYRFMVPWSKLINLDFLKKHNIYFEETIAANDVMFSTKLGFHARKFSVSDKEIYCVTQRTGSLTTRKDEMIFNARLKVYIDYYHYLKTRLANDQFKILGLNGRWLLQNSWKFGLKKFLMVYITLRKNKMKILNIQMTKFQMKKNNAVH